MDTLLTEVVLFSSLYITLNLDRQYFSLFRKLLKGGWGKLSPVYIDISDSAGSRCRRGGVQTDMTPFSSILKKHFLRWIGN